jgi:hypothetical protein
MSNVVHLKWGEEPPSGDVLYLMVTRQGRIRGEDFYVRPSARLKLSEASDAFASLASALKAAQAEASRYGVETIYVRLA